MKLAVLDFHKTQIELSSMDDELPVLIFIVSQTPPEPTLFAQLALLNDYLALHDALDFEEKHLRSLSVRSPDRGRLHSEKLGSCGNRTRGDFG